MPKAIQVQIAEKLLPLATKPKRIKIAVGGRGASKSWAFADCILHSVAHGERVLCAREYQNSIDESVHSLLESRIMALDAPGFTINANSIEHRSGGRIIYKGLARNIRSIKSLHGITKVWIEEGEGLSQETIDTLFPTIRENGSEIWVSMNRGSSKDPIAQTLLKVAEPELERCGYYEDDELIAVEINWRDNPWWTDALEQQRQRDKRLLPRARYDHIWEGRYSDTVENAIIPPEWFDACVDAHIKLGFKPRGVEIVSFDPSDTGNDPKGLCYRHGSVILNVLENPSGDVNEGTDWATGYSNQVKADEFIWDTDGMGVSLKRQISQAFEGKKVQIRPFAGSQTADRPDSKYEPQDGELVKAKTNRETFYNKRAQYYWMLRDRMMRTFQAVERGEYMDPDDLISFSSQIENIAALRSEICRIPRKENGSGRIQIMSKPDMRKLGIESPNMADSVMMSLSGGMVSRRQSLSVEVPAAYSAFR